MKIDIHADDYALTYNTSKEIIDCVKAGKLDSISIIPNMSCFDECMEMLYKSIPEFPFLPLMSVHINLVEGLSIFSGTNSIPAYARLSWGKLYVYSWLNGKKNPIRESIKEEVKAQIVKCQSAINKCIKIAKEKGVCFNQLGLRIDSHQHTHMIPMVWDACISASEETDYHLEYIRNSNEPLMVFLKKKELRLSYKMLNIIKNRILALHSRKADKLCDQLEIDRMYLWGLIMSGNMEIDRVSILYNDIKNYAKEKQRILEILFHPGMIKPLEINDELNSKAVISFYLSEGRNEEMQTVLNYEFSRE